MGGGYMICKNKKSNFNVIDSNEGGNLNVPNE